MGASESPLDQQQRLARFAFAGVVVALAVIFLSEMLTVTKI